MGTPELDEIWTKQLVLPLSRNHSKIGRRRRRVRAQASGRAFVGLVWRTRALKSQVPGSGHIPWDETATELLVGGNEFWWMSWGERWGALMERQKRQMRALYEKAENVRIERHEAIRNKLGSEKEGCGTPADDSQQETGEPSTIHLHEWPHRNTCSLTGAVSRRLSTALICLYLRGTTTGGTLHAM